MKLAGPYAGWVTMTVWRKKSTVLLVSLSLIAGLVWFHYYSGKERNEQEPEEAKVESVQEKRSLLGGSSVQFVMKSSAPAAAEQTRESAEAGAGAVGGLLEPGGQAGVPGAVVAAALAPLPGLGAPSYPGRTGPYIPERRLLHLDLKGAPPKVSYLKKILELSKDLGATGVLLEWEDMFPWWGPLSKLAATNAYSKKDVREILRTAQANKLEVIPLIQTFGHVEFALKQQEFTDLREVPESAQALCPSLNASLDFVRTMIDQVMELHGDAKFLHIGCDEVFQIGECPRCRSQPREELFLSHVTRVATLVRTNYPSTIPIIWDDMLRHLPPNTLNHYRIGQLVEPMVWVYAEDVYRFVPYAVWDKYSTTFPRIWAASAFKGAFGETLYIPNVKRHLENNLRWLEVMSNEGPKFKEGFQGIAITGWQRYDHFSVLCELLPAAVPSLAVSLVAATHGFMNASLKNKLNTHLKCGPFGPTSYFNLNADPFLWDSYSRCAFPGNAFFKLTYRLNNAEKEAEELIQTIRKAKGWMTQYNVRHNFSTPLRVDELMQEQPRVYHTISSLAKSARDSLSDIFDEYTIAEWVEQKIYPFVTQLEQIQRDAIALKARRVWPRRPFAVLQDLHRLGLQIPDSNNDVISPG